MIYRCCTDHRRGAVAGNPAVNGIDYLEVLDSAAVPLGSPRQRTLLVHCLHPLTQPGWTVDNVIVAGGDSIRDITLDWVEPAAPTPPASEATAAEQAYFTALPDAANVLVVRTHVAGDFSTYRLRLVNSAQQAAEDPFEVTETLAGFDPQLAEVDFSFKVECGPDFDCAPLPPDCPPDLLTPPAINYLAKDYGSFRTLMLDRLHQLLPDWAGSSEADLGIALAELMAYVGDHLSYQQDAVATEAYLETARSRISLRRHARLVDYTVADGCNARAWIQLQVSGSAVFLDRSKTRFYTDAPGLPASLAVGKGTEEAALLSGPQVFEPMRDATLFEEQNLLKFYTWGDTGCCLPRGATSATLVGSLTSLQPGDVLIFQEVLGPKTGQAADADLRHRCAVRLTRIATRDGLGNVLTDVLFDGAHPVLVTEIQWADEDALPFALCLSSSFIDAKGDTVTITDVSLAYGNVVLADAGLSFTGAPLGSVPPPRLFRPPDPAADRCQPRSPVPLPVRYRPLVPDSPLTQAVPLPPLADASAQALMEFDPSEAVPAIRLTGTFKGTTTSWTAVLDLLESGESDPMFVVEVEADGTAKLRFGDDANGRRPDSGTSFLADYRIGNGTADNVGADSLVHLAAADARILSCRNPLPAIGGTDLETNAQIRRRAPQAFLTQERAVTMADYDAVTGKNPLVDRAAASLRWTGSWYTVFIAVEPRGGGDLRPSLCGSLERSVGAYRLAGQDLAFASPQYVSLEIALAVCVDPGYFQLDVERALLQVLGSRLLPGGGRGLFYPDNFTFGQTVYLSPLYAAARSVAGVVSVTAAVFQRQGVDTREYLESGEIKLGPLQVARLDNDPDYPNHGQLTLLMEGGK